MDELIEKIASELGERVTSRVLDAVHPKLVEMQKKIKPCYTEKEVGAMFGYSQITMKRLRDAKEIDYCEINKRILYRQEHIDDFLDRHEVVRDGGKSKIFQLKLAG